MVFRSVAEVESVLLELLGPNVGSYVPANLSTHPAIWVSQLFDRVRAAIAAGDQTAVALACDLIASDTMTLSFGKIIKSNLARELRRTSGALSASQRVQLIDALVKLLGLPFSPRELEDYAKLVRKLPRDEYLSKVSSVETQNEKAARVRSYLLAP